MTANDFAHRFAPVLAEVEKRCSVAGAFVDKDLYRVNLATLWANIVMDPDDAGLTEDDIEPLHDYLNTVLEPILGRGQTITECFRFINSKAGEQAMERCHLTQTHKQMLLYFCSMILDPEGHKRWSEAQRKELQSPRRTRGDV
ncbi:MAG TPA: hypothetical protein VFG38_08675 [Pseudomonadales bacterium]|nr:hypothetical protein [Pseudomonadales bacterium]